MFLIILRLNNTGVDVYEFCVARGEPIKCYSPVYIISVTESHWRLKRCIEVTSTPSVYVFFSYFYNKVIIKMSNLFYFYK